MVIHIQMSKAPKIFISCGELSGELHASKLVAEIIKNYPDAKIYAFGSSILKELGVKIIEDYRDFSFSGLTQVLRNLKNIWKLRKRLAKSIFTLAPDYVILIDYGAFNLSLATLLNKKYQEMNQISKNKFKRPQIVQYVAPQIWASRPWRIKQIKKNIDKVFCTLPFESNLYVMHDVPVKYVGNPVLGSLAKSVSKQEFYRLFYGDKFKASEILIGVFPGSRAAEVDMLLPLYLDSIKELRKRNPRLKFRFIISRAITIAESHFTKLGFVRGIDGRLSLDDLTVIEATDMLNANHKLMSAADALWLCSGTATLEAAFYTTPYFLTYKSNWFNYACYLMFRIIDKAGLANIIAGHDIVKEFIQHQATVENFVKETEAWFDETGSVSDYYSLIKANLANLRNDFTRYDSAALVANELFATYKKLSQKELILK
jgi:lipid-A-disaccharide synthase